MLLKFNIVLLFSELLIIALHHIPVYSMCSGSLIVWNSVVSFHSVVLPFFMEFSTNFWYAGDCGRGYEGCGYEKFA